MKNDLQCRRRFPGRSSSNATGVRLDAAAHTLASPRRPSVASGRLVDHLAVQRRAARHDRRPQLPSPAPARLDSSTPGIEGKTIREYLGIVTGEAIVGANIFKDLFASIRDIVGGRSAAYEEELKRAREIAFQEMEAAARQQGGNAVVGIDLDYEVVGQGGSMLMVSVSGTAVLMD